MLKESSENQQRQIRGGDRKSKFSKNTLISPPYLQDSGEGISVVLLWNYRQKLLVDLKNVSTGTRREPVDKIPTLSDLGLDKKEGDGEK